MANTVSEVSKKTGLSPGTLVHVGESKETEVEITLIDYDSTHYQDKVLASIEEALPFKDEPTVTWINVSGLHQVNIVQRLCDHFGIHPLVQEDILNTRQRPKMEDYESYLFIVLKMVAYNEADNAIDEEQLSIILGKNIVITFQETRNDPFVPLKARIKGAKGRLRKLGADYLAYEIIDSVIDHYFVLQDAIDRRIDELEEELLENPTPATMHAIQGLKKNMISLRRSISPVRELLAGMLRGESPLIQEHTEVYLRDVYDHAIRVNESIESFRDMISGMVDIYLSSVSNRLNEIMKVLTIFAAIFIPLTFIAGVYGMNFEYMPELKWKWAYPALWGTFLAVAIVLLVYFRRKKWL